MAQTPIALAADYADAMLTARRAKNWLVLILLLILLVQLTIFLLARYTDIVLPRAEAPAPAIEQVEPAANDENAATAAQAGDRSATFQAAFRYLIGVTNVGGLAFSIILALVVLLIVQIMLVGRLIGVARMTSAWIWAVIFAVLLFPWQAVLAYPINDADFRFAGALYTWSELVRHAHFPGEFSEESILKWARFVVFPVVMLIFLLMVQVKSGRGLREALGEETQPPPPDDEMEPIDRL